MYLHIWLTTGKCDIIQVDLSQEREVLPEHWYITRNTRTAQRMNVSIKHVSKHIAHTSQQEREVLPEYLYVWGGYGQ